MDQATENLLKAHQAIIDAWFEAWRNREQERIDALWARKRKARRTP